jgi:release factor glutamine methyltransferase
MKLRAFLDHATGQLAGASPTARLDAEALLMHATGFDRAALVARGDLALDPKQRGHLETLLARRAAGEPVAYLTGRREFWSLDIEVTPDTLIPRPETELLVERALMLIPHDAEWRVADLGTGSGAIALAIARERPCCRVVATDRSAAALAVAQRNAQSLGLTNVEFRSGHWLDPLAGESFELIASNPPYVRARDPHLAQGDVRFEPRAALVAGPDGLEAIRAIAEGAREALLPGGWLLLEHGHDQAAEVARLLRWYGYGEITSHRDLAGIDRVTKARTA